MFDRYVIKSAERHGVSVRKRDAYLEEQLAKNADSRPSDTDKTVVSPKVFGE